MVRAKSRHVIRGEEWLPSAPLHVLLYEAFGWADSMPAFAHLPLLLKPEGNGKLSKRDGDRLGFPVFPCDWTDPKTGEKSSGYRESGYFPEAIINFLALLGWNPGNDQEVFSMDELIELFTLDRCSKSGAKFDYEKGKWFNHQYLQMKPAEELAGAFTAKLKEEGTEIVEDLFLPDFNGEKVRVSNDYVIKVIDMIKGRANFVTDLWDQSNYFFRRPSTYAEKAVQKYWKEGTSRILSDYCKLIEEAQSFEPVPMEEQTNAWIAEHGYKSGQVYNSVRLALVGEAKGPHLFDITELIGKGETIFRIREAIKTLTI